MLDFLKVVADSWPIAFMVIAFTIAAMTITIVRTEQKRSLERKKMEYDYNSRQLPKPTRIINNDE